MAKLSKKLYIDYDKKADDLWIYTGEKVKISQTFDDFIIDFDKNGQVIGIEILNFHSLLKYVAK